MANGIEKKAFYDLEVEPYNKPISDIDVGFYNLDENTATLIFRISNRHGRLGLSEHNLKAFAYCESTNGSATGVLDLDIYNGEQGLVSLTLPKDFLEASTSTNVNGQIYIAINNFTEDPKNNQVVTLREFSFNVADALINKISSFKKVEYIRMFTDLKTEIEKNIYDIEQAIEKGNDYVAEMEAVRQQGEKSLMQITEISKEDIKETGENEKEEIKNIANQSELNIKNVTSQNIEESEKAKNDVIEAIANAELVRMSDYQNSFSQYMEEVESNNNQLLLNAQQYVDEKEWQKYQLTNDDGSRKWIGTLSQTVENLEVGYYECTIPSNAETVNAPKDVSGNAYLAEINVTVGTSGRKQIVLIQNYTKDVWLKTIHTNNVDRGWELLNPKYTDTGWLTLNFKNGYTQSSNIDYEPSYRIKGYSGSETIYIRFGVKGLKNGKNIVASIPKKYNPYKVFKVGISTVAKTPPKIIIANGDIEVHTIEKDSYSEDDYVVFDDQYSM